MPYQSIEQAKKGKFPTKIDTVSLSLAQINHLAEIYDAINDQGNADNPMIVAIVTWKKGYKVKDGKWVKKGNIKKENDSWYKIIKADDIRRTVLGPVLVPYAEDKQGDIIAPEEIEKAFYDFYGKNVVIKRQHSNKIVEAKVYQRFLTSEHIIVKDENGEEFPEGTWFQETYIPPPANSEPDLYEEIKKGGNFGYSVMGTGKRQEVEESV